MLNIDNGKSYVSEVNLMRALKKCGLDQTNPMVVRNRAGRYTAIFSATNLQHDEVPLMRPVWSGFILMP